MHAPQHKSLHKWKIQHVERQHIWIHIIVCFVITMMYSDCNLKQHTFVWKLTIFSRFVWTPSPLNRESLLRNPKVFCRRSLRDCKFKFCFRNSMFWPFWGQNVGPCWFKNGKKGYFHASHLTPNPVFPKSEVLESHSLLAH